LNIDDEVKVFATGYDWLLCDNEIFKRGDLSTGAKISHHQTLKSEVNLKSAAFIKYESHIFILVAQPHNYGVHVYKYDAAKDIFKEYMSILFKKKVGLSKTGYIKSWVKDINCLEFLYALQDSKIFKIDLNKMLKLKPSLDDQLYEAEIIYENRVAGIEHFMLVPGYNNNRLLVQNKCMVAIYEISIQKYLNRLKQ
jgi:hypothetical protein